MTLEEMDQLKYFSHNDPKRKLSLKSFIVFESVGKGAFGKVYKALKRSNNDKLYAIKVLNKTTLTKPSRVKLALTEVHVMKNLEHPFVIKLKYAFQDKVNLYMVLEYAEGGTLRELLKKHKILKESHAAFYSKEIICGIEYLHSVNVFHRDIKPENILIDEYGHVKLADFGLCKIDFGPGNLAYSQTGTFRYKAPEMREGRCYGREVDWWAFGVIFYEMVCGEHPFDMTEEQKNAAKLFDIYPDFNLSNQAKSLICGMLKYTSRDRLTGISIKCHKFFHGTFWYDVEQCLECPPNFA